MAEQKRKVHLHGQIHNLLGGDLAMVDAAGNPRVVFPAEQMATVYWLNDDAQHPLMHDLVQANDRHANITGAVELVGWMNDSIGLVRPVEPATALCQFWHKSVKQRLAEVRDLPELLAETQGAERPHYYVVTRGVALVAHYRGLPLQHLLIPAEERADASGRYKLSFEALMPARYLLRGEGDDADDADV